MTDINEALAPVLPRELTEISDSVRRVSAPPTPILAEPYRLRLIDPDTDADMISEWMNRPHLVERGSTTGLRRAGTATCVPSWTGNSRPFIGSFRGGDVGYVEL